MITTSYHQYEAQADGADKAMYNYSPDETFLEKLGFLKLTSTAGREKCIFRYHNLNNKGNGFDLIFSDNYSILMVEEFISGTAEGSICYRNTIVGMFHIESDEDLKFIFSRNVRLKYAFKFSKKRICCAESTEIYPDKQFCLSGNNNSHHLK